MAVTISRYNHTLKLLLNKEIDYTALKVMLLSNAATFDAAHDTLAEVIGSPSAEVSGSGWDSGGEALASVAVTTVATDGAMIDCADIEVTATGGDIGPAYGAVIYDSAHADDAPLWFIDFDGAQTAGNGTPFKITINANGLARVTDA